MGVLRIHAEGVDVFKGWLTLGPDDERTHVRVSDVSGWQYAVADGVLTVVTTSVDYKATNQLDRLLWAMVVEGGAA